MKPLLHVQQLTEVNMQMSVAIVVGFQIIIPSYSYVLTHTS